MCVFNSLSDRLTSTFKNLRTRGRLSEADIDATVREIRRALLNGTSSLPEFDAVASKCVGVFETLKELARRCLGELKK